MKMLLADDDPTMLRLLEHALEPLDFEMSLAHSGAEALELWAAERHPLIVTDWLMPELDGQAFCEAIRRVDRARYTYIIVVTACDNHDDIVAGLEAGADDYITKPFRAAELLLRVKAGVRILSLEAALHHKISELESALERVRTLEGLLPICSHCKQIRDEAGEWHSVEAYLGHHTAASFTHAVCPRCLQDHFGPQLQALRDIRGAADARGGQDNAGSP